MANDAYFNNVTLLMHMDDTGLTDVKGHSVTLNGSAARSATQSEFGGYSALFNGSTDYLSIPYSTDFNFGTGDFSIEAWFYLSGNSATNGSGLRNAAIATFGTQASGNTDYWWLSILGDASTTGTGIAFDVVIGGSVFSVVATTTVSQGALHKIEVSRSGTTTRLFLDGSLLTLSTNTLTNQNIVGLTNPLLIGSSAATSYLSRFNGYVDELRITKGIARHTASHAVETAAFPDSMVQIAGTTKNASGAFAAYSVKAHRHSDGALAGSVTSNATTGAFSISALDNTAHYAVCLDTGSENALIFDNITPI